MTEPSLNESDRYELEGMRAAVNFHASTHNPYLFGRGTPEQAEAWAKGQAAVERFGVRKTQGQRQTLHEQGMLLEMFSDPAIEIGRLRQALRNVLLMVNRAKSREKRGREPVPEIWETLTRFCADGGVTNTFVRSSEEIARNEAEAALPSAAQVLTLLADYLEVDDEFDNWGSEEFPPPEMWTALQTARKSLDDLKDHPNYLRTLSAALTSSDLDQEAHWKAGFLRGAKFWYGKQENATMWQSEQNECWQAANKLWPAVRPESLDDARAIAQAFAAEQGERLFRDAGTAEGQRSEEQDV